jgi:hypothetical protein
MKYAFKLFPVPIAALSAALMMVGVASATSETLNVTNDGADSATCGAQTKPCHSINNFWGSTHGPAANGVGDAVGGECDQNGGVTIAKSFATIPFGITAWP